MTNVEQLTQIFQSVYAPFRRDYGDYLFSANGYEFIKFATIIPKVPTSQLTYYPDLTPAFLKSGPGENFLSQISGYYFKERPLFFYNDTDLLNWIAYQQSRGSFNYEAAPIVIKFTLFINGEYQDVYINYDPSKMLLKDELFLLDDFLNYWNACAGIQTQLTNTLAQLQATNNLLVATLAAPISNAAIKIKLQQYLQATCNYVTALQNDPRFVIKVSAYCTDGNNTNQISIIGAIAWNMMQSLSADQNASQAIANLTAMQTDAAAMMDNAKTLISAADASNIDGSVVQQAQAILAAPTATIANNNNNIPQWVWWLLGGAGILLLQKNK